MNESAESVGRCPRCGGPVGCGMAQPGPCWCTTVRLDDAQRAEIARRFDGCLCENCLRSGPARDTARTATPPT